MPWFERSNCGAGPVWRWQHRAAALAEADRPAMGERLCRQLERKARTAKYSTQYELKTKLIRYGLSLGYDYDAVLDAAGELIQTNDEPCDDF